MNEDKQGKPTGTARRPYVAPRVEESAPFEHLVLGCTHSSVTTRSCDPDRSESNVVRS